MHHVAPKMKQIYKSGATFLLNMLHQYKLLLQSTGD